MHFYKLSKNRKFKDVEYSEDTDWESIVCADDPGHQRAGSRIGNLKIDLPSRAAHDFLWTALLNELIISDKAATIFKDNNVTGFELKPVETVAPFPGKLWEFIVVGWAGIAPEKSGVMLKAACKRCGHVVYSGFTKAEYLIDERQWDGSDIFMVWPLPKFIFITEKVANIIINSDLLGAQIQGLDDLAEYAGGELSPGRLSRWMPKKRAKVLDESSGIY